MHNNLPLEQFAHPFEPGAYTEEELWSTKPFFTNLDKNVYSPIISSPEVVGALCSRTSRAADDLRRIFLNEYLRPFLDVSQQENETDEQFQERKTYGEDLKSFIDFLHKHPTEKIFSNPKARSFYTKWLAQYGDDSIAQMAGMHLVYTGLSQLAIKHLEDQRIGLAPLEKSTRYVDYSKKVAGHYQYYTDPTLQQFGLEEAYRDAMDTLFQTYVTLLPQLSTALQKKFPDESASVVEKKAFDTLRGLLPVSTLSQVAFFGNGQAFEYMVTRCLQHALGEVRWAGEQAYEELFKIAPSFLRRIKDQERQETATAYQRYIAEKGKRVSRFAQELSEQISPISPEGPHVELVEFDPHGEDKVITSMIYNTSTNKLSWSQTFEGVRNMSSEKKEEIIRQYLEGRTQRWQKVGRAFENAYVRFEITMNIGAWRDLHRHRMMTQQRQYFTCDLGYDIDPEIIDAGLETPYRAAMEKAAHVYSQIAKHDQDIAQYAVPMAYRVRFQQYKNLRQCFWELELRTIPEGHPDYRHIEQMKFKLLEKVYPLITQHMRVNMGEYDFARRGQEEKIQAKLQELEKLQVV